MSKGRYVPLSPARRMVADWMYFCRNAPNVIAERRLELAPVQVARALCEPKPSWVGIFLKAFCTVAARRPELRRTYMPYPWPHLYEHSCSQAIYTLERLHDEEPVVVLAKLKSPESWSLRDLDSTIRKSQERPLLDFPIFRRAMRTSWLPGFIRRALLWGCLSFSGRFRATNFGTFALSSPAAHGAGLVQLQTMMTSTLHYGMFERDGSLNFRLTFDHRVYDGAFAARVLVDMEQVLLTEVLAELHGMRRSAAAA